MHPEAKEVLVICTKINCHRKSSWTKRRNWSLPYDPSPCPKTTIASHIVSPSQG